MKTFLFFLVVFFASSLARAVDDVYVTCSVSPCTIVHQISIPPFQLDTEDGALIAGAVLAVWALGFGFRAIIRALSVDSKQPSESDL